MHRVRTENGLEFPCAWLRYCCETKNVTVGLTWLLGKKNTEIAYLEFNLYSTNITESKWQLGKDEIEKIKAYSTDDEVSRLEEAVSLIRPEAFFSLPPSQQTLMKYPSEPSIGVNDLKIIQIPRPMNQYPHRQPTHPRHNYNASSTPLTTSCSVILSENSEGNEFDRKDKQASQMNVYKKRKINNDHLPWLSTNDLSTAQELEYDFEIEKDPVAINSSFDALIKGKYGFEADPVEVWLVFSPTKY
ncbi:unnamed protein product [Rotaria socialis]|uniref:Uncharacterized protein n=3 Tax=Rotaria socialis TaxID=392032 RepID=A0A820Q8I7_9BILA|nr:unnamed protein product [Rotaria socialis]